MTNEVTYRGVVINDGSTIDKLKEQATDKEANLFFSLCENGNDFIEVEKFKEIIFNSGLQQSDDRLESLFNKLQSQKDNISFDNFLNIIRTSPLLVQKSLRGELAIPDFQDFSKNMDKIYEKVKQNTSGELASYIPPLKEVDPEQFGIAIVTIDGQVYQRGESNVDFSIQSMVKPFNYCFALEKFNDMPEMWLELSWDREGQSFHKGSLVAVLANEPGSLADVTKIISLNDGNISNIQVFSRDLDYYKFNIDLEVKNIIHLNQIIAAMRLSEFVESVERGKD